jgi:hypothetical protein
VNIKIDHEEKRWVDMNWIELGQDRNQWKSLVNKVVNLGVPKIVGKFLSSFAGSGCSRSDQLHEAS